MRAGGRRGGLVAAVAGWSLPLPHHSTHCRESGGGGREWRGWRKRGEEEEWEEWEGDCKGEEEWEGN